MHKKRESADIRNQRRYGVNPVTGKTFNRHEAKMFRKYGVKENGILRSKFEASNKITRQGRTAGRNIKREYNGKARVELAEQGIDSSPMKHIADLFKGIFGGSNEEEEENGALRLNEYNN